MRRRKPYLVYVLRIRFTDIFYVYVLRIHYVPDTSSPFLFHRHLLAAYIPVHHPIYVYVYRPIYVYVFRLIYVYVYRSYKRMTAAHPFYVYVYCTDRRYICIRLLLKVSVEVVARFSAAALCALRES